MNSSSVEKKEYIIQESIKLLKDFGLKFSIDVLSANTKMSKKTIYSFFQNKENLAYAVYEHVFHTYTLKTNEIMNETNLSIESIQRMFLILQDAYFYADESIFNRFSINDKLRAFVQEKIDNLLGTTIELIKMSPYSSLSNHEVLPIVIDSTIKKIRKEERKDSLLQDFVDLLCGKKQ